jgi:hypothetical protein
LLYAKDNAVSLHHQALGSILAPERHRAENEHTLEYANDRHVASPRLSCASNRRRYSPAFHSWRTSIQGSQKLGVANWVPIQRFVPRPQKRHDRMSSSAASSICPASTITRQR